MFYGGKGIASEAAFIEHVKRAAARVILRFSFSFPLPVTRRHQTFGLLEQRRSALGAKRVNMFPELKDFGM